MTNDEPEHDDLATTAHEDLLQRFVADCTPEQQRRGTTPEAVLGALSPEERLALLDSPHLILELPQAVLEALPDTVLEKLSPTTREAIRKRLGR